MQVKVGENGATLMFQQHLYKFSDVSWKPIRVLFIDYPDYLDCEFFQYSIRLLLRKKSFFSVDGVPAGD